MTEPARKIHVYEGPAPAPSKLAIPPARNPSSKVIVIWNLVRPFTPNQLRELLLRTGRLAEGGFWLDNIKSTCLAMVSFDDDGGGNFFMQLAQREGKILRGSDVVAPERY